MSKSRLLTSGEFGLDYTSRDTMDSIIIIIIGERTKIKLYAKLYMCI